MLHFLYVVAVRLLCRYTFSLHFESLFSTRKFDDVPHAKKREISSFSFFDFRVPTPYTSMK